MRLNSFYPVLLTDDVAASAAFFLEHLGFRETFRNEWYVSLVHGDREEYELAFVQRTHESVPAGYRAVSNVLLNVEVEDAAHEHFVHCRKAGNDRSYVAPEVSSGWQAVDLGELVVDDLESELGVDECEGDGCVSHE